MAKANSLLFNALLSAGAISLSLLAVACGSGEKSEGNFPSDFNNLTDTQKVAYVMQHATPDSVARFVCNVPLGKVPGVTLDYNAATIYVYDTYKTEDQAAYAAAFDSYVDSLPLPDRMRLYSISGAEDPQGLGYKLGLDYVRSIRDNHMTPDQVEKELKEFKKACGTDTETYHRFIVGFHTVLNLDHGKDLPEEIYTRFINYE